MADVSTFILLDRNIINWRWYKTENTFRLFIHLLLKANAKDKPFENIVIHRGELVTSLDHLSRETRLTVNQVRTALKHLKNTGEITSKITSKYSLIKIVNYDTYQNYKKYNDKHNDKQITSKAQANHKQSTTTNTDNTDNTVNTDNIELLSLREIEELKNQ